MTRRHRLIALAAAALCSLALAGPASARILSDPYSQQSPAAATTSTDPNGDQQGPALTSAPRSPVVATSGNGTSTWTYVAVFGGGIALLGVASGMVVSSRRGRLHGAA